MTSSHPWVSTAGPGSYSLSVRPTDVDFAALGAGLEGQRPASLGGGPGLPSQASHPCTGVSVALLLCVSVHLSSLLCLSRLSRFPRSWESPGAVEAGSVLAPLTLNRAARTHRAESQQPRPCLILPAPTSSGCRSAVKVTISTARAHTQARGPVPGELLAGPAVFQKKRGCDGHPPCLYHWLSGQQWTL